MHVNVIIDEAKPLEVLVVWIRKQLRLDPADKAAPPAQPIDSVVLAAASHLVDQGEALRAEIDTFLGEVRAA